MNKDKEKKKQFINYPFGVVGIASNMERMNLKGKKLFIVTAIILILCMLLVVLLTIGF